MKDYLTIKQKLLINTEILQANQPSRDDKTFVLYLPYNEIHELGLMYLNYEILLNGYKTIFLGESVPVESLKDLKKYFNNITFVTYVTVQPDKDFINEYVQNLNKEILDETSEAWIIGRMTEYIDKNTLSSKIKIFTNIKDLVEEL